MSGALLLFLPIPIFEMKIVLALLLPQCSNPFPNMVLLSNILILLVIGLFSPN